MLFKIRQPLAIHALCAMAGIIAADRVEGAGNPDKLWTWAAALSAILWIAWSILRWRAVNSQSRAPRRWASIAACLATAALFFAWHTYLVTEGPGAKLAAQVPPQGVVVRTVGVVDEEPEAQRRIPVRLESVTADGHTSTSHASVLVRWKGSLPRYGDRVELDGDLHRLAPARNPGGFDSPAYWRTQGITCELRVRYPGDARVLAPDCGRPFFASAFALRHWMERTLALDLQDSPQLAGLIQSMVLGSKGESMEETRSLFQYTGTMHLFAVSGMNVAMLAAIANSLLMSLGLFSRRGIAALVIPLLWVYCYATGLTPSSLRATVMATIYFAGVLVNRSALSWNTLGAAVLALTAWNPGTLFTAGFQLSFAMVAFLLLCVPPLQRWWEPKISPDPFLPRSLWSDPLKWRTQGLRFGMEALVISTLAWIGSTPLMIHYFHLWSPATIPANLVAVGLAWMMLVLGLASVLAGTFCQWLAILFNNANWLVAKILLAAITAIAELPYSHLFVELPSLRPAPLCEVEVMDVPGGAATHLRVNGGRRRDWLLDCGSSSAVGYTVLPYLRSRGINRLDGLLLTHGDSQHIGGAVDLLHELAPLAVVDSPLRDRSSARKAVHEHLMASSQGKDIVARGDVLTLAPDVHLHVLYPPAGLDTSRADDKALVLRLDAAGKRILFTSDAGFRTEMWLLENAPPEELRCDLWVKQAHPKDLSGTPDFVEAVHPALIIASGAAFPPEEQINEPWATGIEARGIRLLRQDRDGAVRITLQKDGQWDAVPFLTAQPGGK